jgi:VWFA-related protein
MTSMISRTFLSGATAAALLCGAALLPAQSPTPAPQQPAPTTSTPPSQTTATTASQTPATPGQNSADPQLQQHPGADENNPGFTITTSVNEVNLIFTVTGKNGHFVTGLQQQDFGLLDDGRPPSKVRVFKQQTNLPLRVGIMLDTSSSIRQRFEFEQQAATDFLLQTMHPADRAFVEGFDVNVDVSQDFTNRVDLLDTGIRKLRPGGGTALFDSLYITCRDQMLTLQSNAAVRKALVLVSDGDDDYSRALESEAIKMCQRAETIVYTISTNVGPSRDKGDDVLQQIADATGGQAFYPRRIEDVAIGFQNIEEELRSQYSLIYVPADFKHDGSFRTIYLQARNGAYNVRARKGYFAPKE